MTVKIDRNSNATFRFGSNLKGCRTGKPVVSMDNSQCLIYIHGPGIEVSLLLDREQFNELFDAMVSAVQDEDRKNMDAKPDPEIPVPTGPNLA